MQFRGAVVKEQGVTFAIVIVKEYVVNNTFKAKDCIRDFEPVFCGLPVVLMAQDYKGRAKYYGRKDIVRFLANVPLRAIPWKKYTMN